MNQSLSRYFSKNKCFLDDSSSTSCNHVVSSFKCNAGRSLSQNQSELNALPQKPRVKSVNCIRLSKGRFPCPCNIRIRVCGRDSMKKMCQYVEACVVLHKLTFDIDDAESCNERSVQQVDDLQEENEVNQSSDFDVSGRNDVRLQQIVSYLGELSSTQM